MNDDDDDDYDDDDYDEDDDLSEDWALPIHGFMVPISSPRVAPPVRDPIVEPLWSGTRILVHYQAASAGRERLIRTFGAFGAPVQIEDADVASALRESVAADDAVIDGVITTQALRGGSGAAPILEPSRGLLRSTGVDTVRRDAYENPALAFVGIDLLYVDGQTLVDLPLLERKRLLESVLITGDRVRISAFVRPPIEGWLVSWKAAGFDGVMLKAANSRYEPGGNTYEWRRITQIGRRA